MATAASLKAESTGASSSTAAVLDFDAREVDPEDAVRTRRLLGRVLASHGPAGLARALHVSAPRAAQLKHRVACLTCRSRLDPLAASLATASASVSSVVGDGADSVPAEGPAPLTAWLAADGGRGLAPAPRALRDLGALAAFLAAFASNSPGACGAGGFDDVVEDPGGRKQKNSSAVMRCPYHAHRTTVSRTAVTAMAPCRQISDLAALVNASSPVSAAVVREQERMVSLLRSGTSDAEWKQLGGIDIDDAMCDLFAWLGDRGLCSSCIDAVTGALLEVRKAVAGSDVCTCSRCNGRCSNTRKQAAKLVGMPQLSRELGGPAELVRVQGRLRAICGVYRQEPQLFNGRPVYKKERIEAYLLHTSLKDWMISGRPDAGGSRCEGWAYVTDSAESPDEICGVWKVSGPRGWEEDRSLQVTAFAELPEQLRAGIGYDDGSAIAKCLAANERGILVVPLCEQEVLEDVLWAPEEPPPGRSRNGGCAHILTPETVQRELRCWLRWLLRDRLEAQRRRILAQAQVGASLCRLFACAALQQLEQAAETPAPGARARDKKGRLKKGKVAAQDYVITDVELDACIGEAEIMNFGDVMDVDKSSVDLNDSKSTSSPSPITPITADSDESSSTRASSEEPPDARSAVLATGARRLMEQMGWKPEVGSAAALNGAEVAAWHEQHPRYRQLIREERQKLKTEFQKWALHIVQ